MAKARLKFLRSAEERHAYLELIGKRSPFWLGTPDPGTA
jgi:hypothetical protein